MQNEGWGGRDNSSSRGNWRRGNSNQQHGGGGHHNSGRGGGDARRGRGRGGGGPGVGREYFEDGQEVGARRFGNEDRHQQRRGRGRGYGNSGGYRQGPRPPPLMDNNDEGGMVHRSNNNLQNGYGAFNHEAERDGGQRWRGQSRRQGEERGRYNPRARGRQYNNDRQRHHHQSALNPNAPDFQPSNVETENWEESGLLTGSRESLEEDEESYGSGKGRRRGETEDKKKDERQQSVKDKPRNQREVLTDQLSRNNHECMVCCDKVRYSHPIWHCKRCFNVFHLSCIKKWVAKSDDEAGWRCPSCQSIHENSPEGYFCFCGKTKNPKAARHEVPHTCGQQCGKPNPGGVNCTHSCNIQCHPGPCPTCEVQQVRFCGCGKTQAQVLCGSKTVIGCENICNKRLNCGVHQCTRMCHQGECSSCEEIIKHVCHCARDSKEVKCTLDSNKCKTYSCSNNCNKPLSCGYHNCDDKCHSGPCGRCKTAPEVIISCPCGQTGISEACKLARIPPRKKCTDRIPTCGKTCLRMLSCGGDPPHRCQEKCHLNKECPPCNLTSTMKCRCGTKSIEIACRDLKNRTEITCQKKCSKKRSCGKHKCTSTCCIDVDHICPIVCQRPLRCGLHKCERLCHFNPCPPCGNVSFDELACECGASIIYPPVPCGTKRPPCQRPCSRQHVCDHPVHHPCHSEPSCPPCTVLTEKWCHGLHELRKNVMCHITNVSCGLKCKKPLACGRHSCPKVCHAGSCLDEGEVCKLPCSVSKPCGHPCGAPCHEGECPESKCKVNTVVNCPCGRRSDTMICWKRENEYDRTVTWEYHKEIKKLEEEAKAKGEDVNLSDDRKAKIMQAFKETIPKSAVLECDKECAKLERNRKLAEALQLENADTTTTSLGTPNYSEFLLKFAKKNPQFIESIHKQLTDLVLKAKQSTKKNVTYGFISMNRDKRHVVHEYSDHFGVLSESFDEEPNRNVVCFASKEKSYLPSVSLVDAVFRPAFKSERLKPQDDVTFRPDKRTQIVGPSNWNMKARQQPSSASRSEMVTLNIPGASAGSSDFPPL